MIRACNNLFLTDISILYKIQKVLYYNCYINNFISTSFLIFSYLRGPGYDGLEAEIHEVIQVTQKSSTEVNI